MGNIFGIPKPKGPSKATQRAQRRQSKQIDDATAEEAKQIGSRRRLMEARRSSGGLFAKTGGAGVKETFG